VSATRLLVLGVVRMHGKAHGYQVRRELLTWSADKWANVQPGSIYHALKQMTKEGLLELADGDTGAGPDRVAYRLTEDGETEFQVQLGKSLSTADQGAQGAYALAAAVTFMTALPRARVISLLRHRLTQLDGEHAAVVSALERSAGWGQPAHLAELYRLWCSTIDATAQWVRDLVERLESGEYVMADDGPDHFGCPVSMIQT
jgi:DNA-binding PadR family transcriptional regulator